MRHPLRASLLLLLVLAASGPCGAARAEAPGSWRHPGHVALAASFPDAGEDPDAIPERLGRALSQAVRDLLESLADLPPDVRPESLASFPAAPSARLAAAGLACLSLYGALAWLLRGRPPRPGPIRPRADVPDGLTAPEARYLWRKGPDEKLLPVALVELAVAGGLRIHGAGGVFTLVRGEVSLPQDAWPGRLSAVLFGPVAALRVDQGNRAVFLAARRTLRTSLAAGCRGALLTPHLGARLVGLVLAGLVVAGTALLGENPLEALGLSLWLTLWLAGLVLLGRLAWQVLARVRRRGLAVLAVALAGAAVFAVPFFAGAVVGLGLLARSVSVPAVVCLLALAGVAGLLWNRLRVVTEAGRRRLDAVAGVRLYLTQGGHDRSGPGPDGPEALARLLPLAMALDLEDAWAARLAEAERRFGRPGRVPAWLTGPDWAEHGYAAFRGGPGPDFAAALALAISSDDLPACAPPLPPDPDPGNGLS